MLNLQIFMVLPLILIPLFGALGLTGGFSIFSRLRRRKTFAEEFGGTIKTVAIVAGVAIVVIVVGRQIK